jgi:hypothetical protein
MLGPLAAAVLGICRDIGIGLACVRVFHMSAIVMGVLLVAVGSARCCRSIAQIGMGHRRGRLAAVGIIVIMLVVRPVVIMLVLMTFIATKFIAMTFMVVMVMVVMAGIGGMRFVVMGMKRLLANPIMVMRRMLVIPRLLAMGGIGACLDDAALHALPIAAAARVAVTWAAAVVGAVLALFLGFAMGALVGLDQGLTVGDRNLIVVGMDFAEGQEAVTVAAVFDEGGLQRRLYARDLGEIDVSAQLFALGGLEIKFFDAIAADHHDPGFFRMGGIDQHFVGHFGTLGGGGRVLR